MSHWHTAIAISHWHGARCAGSMCSSKARKRRRVNKVCEQGVRRAPSGGSGRVQGVGVCRECAYGLELDPREHTVRHGVGGERGREGDVGGRDACEGGALDDVLHMRWAVCASERAEREPISDHRTRG
jgi:hypothetical protein